MSGKVKVDVSKAIVRLKSIRQGTIENMAEVTKNATAAMLNETQREAPKDTGELAQKQRMTINNSGARIEGRVETYAEHAVYVHEGTGIYARGGKGRKTPWGYTVESGRSKYKGFHWTRGQKAQPWMEDIVKRRKPDIVRMYRSVIGG